MERQRWFCECVVAAETRSAHVSSPKLHKGTFFKYVRSGGEGGCHENADRSVQGEGGVGKMHTYAMFFIKKYQFHVLF